MKKDAGTTQELSREHLLDLTKRIPVVGIKERKLNPDQQTVVEVMRDVVFHLVSGKSLDIYQMAEHVGQLPPNTRAILGLYGWQDVFRSGKDCGWFKGEDLSCELVEILGPEPGNETNIELKSLSSELFLTGLTEKTMNQTEVTGEARVELLTKALVAHRLKVEPTGSRLMAVSFGFGPAITGRAV